MPNIYPYQQMYPQQYQQIQQPVQQIQNGGFISVRNVNEAMNYPVAHGMSVTFKDETAPYIYTKTMGFSQMDRPTFEMFKLVKENIVEEPTKENTIDVTAEISALWNEINALKEQPKRTRKKEEVVKDDAE